MQEVLEKQQEMLQNVGALLQSEQQHIEAVVAELPTDTQRQIKEHVMKQQLTGSTHSLTGSRIDLFPDSDRSQLFRSTGNLSSSDPQFAMTRKSCVPGQKIRETTTYNPSFYFCYGRTVLFLIFCTLLCQVEITRVE